LGFRCDGIFRFWRCLLILSFLGFASETSAQAPALGPPAVGVVRAEEKPLIETSEFLGRIQAIGRVNLVARVTGFLEKRFFDEGSLNIRPRAVNQDSTPTSPPRRKTASR
jgi:multidrug efflux pump subunit AcrA (membrane-fusion protein)